MSQQRSRLTCEICGEPIRRSKDSYDERIVVQPSHLERAWHYHCLPNSADDSPLQAAVQKAKQAIEDARRLDEEAFESFREIVALALYKQRS